jgi:hypothetical protein
MKDFRAQLYAAAGSAGRRPAAAKGERNGNIRTGNVIVKDFGKVKLTYIQKRDILSMGF